MQTKKIQTLNQSLFSFPPKEPQLAPQRFHPYLRVPRRGRLAPPPPPPPHPAPPHSPHTGRRGRGEGGRGKGRCGQMNEEKAGKKEEKERRKGEIKGEFL